MRSQLAHMREELDRMIERLEAGLGQTGSGFIASPSAGLDHTGSGFIGSPVEIGELRPIPGPNSRVASNEF